ncbi:glycosyltransferase family 9 protein [Leptotrichia sp. OH3620_COT-345]|uniref:glycosyltransferase family 9 protein n=1 Tax=Leptotrichia sp. OH3620_COT-345 TaxID=2491048 RepID=UPI000F64A21B|nr:glycosyltransferase family 9 protein [Leptotrichia sp. OH3620_COT-345]RRD39166.1 glycosyltransferase family 9 protein [Leptotrichia sp. OH3620_COT-345]
MKILIIRFSSFGDIVLTTPVIKKIKEKYPEATIDFLVYTTFSEAISLNPNVKKVVLFDREKSKDRKYIKKIINKLKSENYNYIIDLHSKFLSRIIGKNLENKKTKYYRYKKRKWWKTLLVKAKLINYKADCTIVESYFTSLKKLGIYFDDNARKLGKGDDLEFYIDKNQEKKLIQKYNLLSEKYIVLSPGASKFTKKWPFYNELAKKIVRETDIKIFITGGKEDYDLIEKNDRIINLCGKISFKESGVIIKYAEISVVNDSGPFHISRALKTKTFVFFGPTDPDLFSFEDITFLIKNSKCIPHSLYGDDKFPKKYEKCMSDISVEEVYEKIIGEYYKKGKEIHGYKYFV